MLASDRERSGAFEESSSESASGSARFVPGHRFGAAHETNAF